MAGEYDSQKNGEIAGFKNFIPHCRNGTMVLLKMVCRFDIMNIKINLSSIYQKSKRGKRNKPHR